MPKMATGNNNQRTKSRRVCLVSFPMPSAPVVKVLLASLIEILEPSCDPLYVITANIPKEKFSGSKVKFVDVKTSMHFRDSIHPRWWSTILQFFKIITIQVKMCLALVRISRRFDIGVFWIGVVHQLPLVLLARKILRKRVIIIETGPGLRIYSRDFAPLSHAFRLLLRANYFLASLIIVQSKSTVDFLGLTRYDKKLVTSGARHVETELFRLTRKLNSRDNLIGYIGRLDIAKGVMQLVDAIPMVLEAHDDVKFLIGGSGSIYQRIEQQMEDSDLHHNVKLTGWIPHDELPHYLNELKLLVLPSYSEGLPTIILEAMACGTPVLATPVGAVPDVIKDGETGFIMENNSPECIAQNILRALNHGELEQITRQARSLVEKEYTYEQAVTRYEEILAMLDDR